MSHPPHARAQSRSEIARPNRTGVALLGAVALFVLGASVGAQQPSHSLVKLRVVDSSGAPIPDANVSLVSGVSAVLASGTTDAAGQHALELNAAAGDYEAVVRKIGYARADRFFSVRSNDTLTLSVVLTRAAQSLAPVNVTAEEDVRRRAYHIGADDIATSPRPLLDAMDIVSKLRPQMIYPRNGPSSDACGLFYLWVNGEKIRLGSHDNQTGNTNNMLQHGAMFAGTIRLGLLGIVTVPLHIQSALATIKPEHVAEMSYHDCNESSADGLSLRNTLFVTLKPGIAFRPGIGSFVISSDEASGALMAARAQSRADSAAAVVPLLAGLEPYRHRLLGIFDVDTGAPLPDVEVRDTASGAWVRTTQSGIISLAFLPPGQSTVRLRRAGAADTLIHVAISPADTTPITIILGKTP